MFKEIVGDVFDLKVLKPDAICITTNGVIKSNGCNVMGAGIAKQARDKIHNLDKLLGDLINHYGNQVHPITFYEAGTHLIELVAFPTKHHWKQKSDLRLIEKSTKELLFLTEIEGWTKVIVPRPGCSNGGRQWLSEVKPIMEKYLDDRFYIIRKN